MTTAIKGLDEMTTAELTALWADVEEARREVKRKMKEMQMGAPGWTELHESQHALFLESGRIFDALDARETDEMVAAG